MLLALWLVVLAALTALSLRSATTLDSASPWTRAGWIASALYAVLAAAHALAPRSLAPAVVYAPIALLTAAFVVAGVRDEAQAEPWWWPTHVGPTGRARRRDRM